jgi:hypothetical protein
VDIGGHPPIPTGSSCPFFIQHIFLYCFIIVSYTLLGCLKPHTFSRWIWVASLLIQLAYFVCFHVNTSCCTSKVFLGP